MNLNPRFVAAAGFLLTGLIWSGGNVVWLIILGLFVLYAILP